MAVPADGINEAELQAEIPAVFRLLVTVIYFQPTKTK